MAADEEGKSRKSPFSAQKQGLSQQTPYFKANPDCNVQECELQSVH
jgi:hypothetical protein